MHGEAKADPVAGKRFATSGSSHRKTMQNRLPKIYHIDE